MAAKWTPMRLNEPTGLYRIYGSGDVLLYVGIGRFPQDRISAHRRLKPWSRLIRRTEVEWLPTRPKALIAEADAIISEFPLFNIDMNRGRGDWWLSVLARGAQLHDLPPFSRMVDAEPRLEDLVRRIWRLSPPPGCCPEDAWPAIKSELRNYVGYLADEQAVEHLRDASAYQIAAEVLQRMLPNCRPTCVCMGVPA